MTRDLNGEIQRRSQQIARETQQHRQQAKARVQKGKLREFLVNNVGSIGGLPIREVPEEFAPVEARRLLAGFVLSATAANIPVARVELGASAGMGRRLRSSIRGFRGWNVVLGTFEHKEYETTRTSPHMGTVTPEYNLYVSPSSLKPGWGHIESIEYPAVQQWVVDTLARHGGQWIEPPRTRYV